MAPKTPTATRQSAEADFIVVPAGEGHAAPSGSDAVAAGPTSPSPTPGSQERPPDLEAAVSQLLDELSGVQDELLEVLAAKCDRIADGDLDGINGLQEREALLGTRLQACHDQRGALLAMAAEEGLPGDTLGSLATSLTGGQGDHLKVQVKEASARMRLLQHRSLANWVLTQRSMLHLSQLLEIIATGGRLQPTYERDGSSTSSGALVDQDA